MERSGGLIHLTRHRMDDRIGLGLLLRACHAIYIDQEADEVKGSST
jgi:hypothetical protein